MLAEYKKKRNLKKSGEPAGDKLLADNKPSRKGTLVFVVHKHNSSHLHYDFRLELDGVLKSWAIPKGPSLNPSEKRLAVKVEDHPYDYRKFEGIIPSGNYGAGEVIVWDEGTYYSSGAKDIKESEQVLRRGLQNGRLEFFLLGKKLKGNFVLIKMRRQSANNWLLIKKKDEYASNENITSHDKSVLSGQTIIGLHALRNDAAPIEKESYLKGGKKKKIPKNIKPMLATLVNAPFDDPLWAFEIKWDGYRAIAEINNGEVDLHSRNNLSFNAKFAPIVQSLHKIRNSVILDGEIVALDDNGRSDFQLLQNFQKTGEGTLAYYLFDILYLDGYDLTDLPFLERKKILKDFLPHLEKIRYGDHVIGEGKNFFKLAQKNNLEGIVAKKADSRYQCNRRGRDWLKIKNHLRQEAVICGFTKPRGSRKNFGALVLGLYHNGTLRYIGNAGTGFDENKLNAISDMLKPLMTKIPPFKRIPKINDRVAWVKPELVCEVSFTEWTKDGYMRQPVFRGLREDKNSKDVKREVPEKISNIKNLKSPEKKALEVENSGKVMRVNNIMLKLTHLDKVFFPDEGYNKADLLDYYNSISKFILPYLKDRPQALNRYPNGIYEESFYQKDIKDVPEWIKTKAIYSQSNRRAINYFICNDKASLLYLVNLGCIEINPWFSRSQHLEFPDYSVIDLDPLDIGFDKVIEVAQAVKEVLDKADAKGFCKTSGATGMHIYIPMRAKYGYEISREFALLVSEFVHKKLPDFTSLERNPPKRKGKVYLDYLQNREGVTLAAPYSVRPKPGATVSTPLEWREVKKGLYPEQFTIKNILKRLDRKGDIFNGVLGKGIDIIHCIKALKSLNVAE